MTRRDFLVRNIGSATGAIALTRLSEAASTDPDHRLPSTDQDYRRSSRYIEEVPIPQYHWASPSAYEAFRDIKYGVRLHFGLYSILGHAHESWPFLKMTFPERVRYQELYKTWNPSGFDAGQWTGLFADSGMKMFAFTRRHHEGFSMFEKKTRVVRRVNYRVPGHPVIETCDLAYSIAETPFRRDFVGELCEAGHSRGLKVDLYYSNSDWYDADFRPYGFHPLQVPSSPKLDVSQSSGTGAQYWDRLKVRFLDGKIDFAPDPTPEDVKRMVARHRTQIMELLTRYGTIDMLGLDIWWGPAVWPQLRQTLLDIRKIQPNVMLRALGIGNYGDYYAPEDFVPGAKENADVPWFVIYSLGSSFSYERDAAKYKGAPWIVKTLVDTVAKGGNLMVGIGPNGTGRFHPTAIDQVREAGQWLKVNGEGIYSTRPRAGVLWREGDSIRFTRTKDNRTIYALTLTWPGRELTHASVRARPGGTITMLGRKESRRYRQDSGKGRIIEIPAEWTDPSRRPPGPVACFKIESEEA